MYLCIAHLWGEVAGLDFSEAARRRNKKRKENKIKPLKYINDRLHNGLCLDFECRISQNIYIFPKEIF